ncbi:ribitol 5-phosphate transferase FKRP isoform X2 [Lycorma delicatula]|uniref:ribitol 5-phosphate transferase FKRP isoform X2 n=1 Tax=Lycorma delicatula TaxID=130591 RepID=UPI003F518378
MRIKFVKFIILSIIFLNILALYFIWMVLSIRSRNKPQNGFVPAAPTNGVPSHEELKKRTQNDYKVNDVTIIIRSFEEFDNDIPDTLKSIVSIYSNVKILVVCDKPLYPPLNINISSPMFQNVKIINLNPSLNSEFEERIPLLHIKGKYVLFVPDSIRFSTKQVFSILLEAFHKQSQSILAIPIKSSKPVKCLKLQIETREWFIKFSNAESADDCDFVRGRHALFMKSDILHKLSDSLMLPFPDAFYIQAASKGINVQLITDIFFSSGKSLFNSHHAQWKLLQLERDRQKKMFHNLQLKKVVKETGVTEWFGCRRDTPRCFGTVVDETPPYLWEGKWTPPCCLAGLRRVARHVFHQLERSGVRYWLEGGSLLGAMRHGDILPWDYDVDIGIYKEDIPRCTWLQRANTKPVTDEQGFVWEKAVEDQKNLLSDVLQKRYIE